MIISRFFYNPCTLKYILFLFLNCISFLLFAQQRIQILDKSTNFPVEHVEVQDGHNNVLAISDNQGYLRLPSNTSYIYIEHPGFPPQEFEIPVESNIIYLNSDLVRLNSITVVANDDRSLDLIKRVIRNQPKNSPTALGNYKFKSYTKLTVDANGDSIPYIKSPKTKRDTIQNKSKKILEESMLFISERAINHYYDKKFGKKNVVEAARIAGLRTPLYEVIALQPLSYEFTEDKFNFFFRSFPNPLSKVGMKKYNFSIMDTIHQGGKDLIEVNFNSKNKEKKSIHGFLLIDKASAALVKFFAENETKAGSDTYIEVGYEPFKNIWKPTHQIFKLESHNYGYEVVRDSIAANGDTIQLRTRKETNSWMNTQTTFSDFHSPVDIDKKVFQGYESEVQKKAFKDFEDRINTFRIDSLNVREKGAYVKMDSIGQANKFDRDILLLRIFTQRGWLTLGELKLNLLDIINFNDYEDYRLGVNLKTSSSFSTKYGLNVRTFYGFGDKVFKYGLGGWYNINQDTNAQIFVDYSDDITAAGRFENPTADFRRIFDFRDEQSANPKYVDQIKQTVGYRRDFFQKVSAEFSLNAARERSLFDYSYMENSMDEEYQNNFIKVAFRYAPNEKHIQSPLGKFTYNKSLPYYYFMIDQGVEMLDGDLDYTRLQFMTQQQIPLFNSPTIINLRLGKVLGEVPIWQYFDGPGKAKDRTKFFQRARFGGSAIFETMAQGEFISDQFIYGSIQQRIASIKLGKTTNIPVSVIYKAGYGTLDNKENHNLLDYQEMDKLYQEAGLEFDNILFNIVGAGFYYRFGAYNQDNFATDFSVKAILNFDMF